MENCQNNHFQIKICFGFSNRSNNFDILGKTSIITKNIFFQAHIDEIALGSEILSKKISFHENLYLFEKCYYLCDYKHTKL